MICLKGGGNSVLDYNKHIGVRCSNISPLWSANYLVCSSLLLNICLSYRNFIVQLLFANIYFILNRLAMEKLYAVFTDYEHDKVGIPSVLFGDYFVVTHSILFVHVSPICLQ